MTQLQNLEVPETPLQVDLDSVESAALARLIEEVRNEERAMPITAYNRTYHRHNR